MTTHFDAVLTRCATYIRSLSGHSLETAAEKAWANALKQGWISPAVFKSYCLIATEQDGEIHLELDTKFQTVVFDEACEICAEIATDPAAYIRHARNYYPVFSAILKRVYDRDPPKWIKDIIREELEKAAW